MNRQDKTIRTNFLCIISMLLVIHYMTIPITWNLNKSIGWGLELKNYYGIGLVILVLGLTILTLFSIFRNNLNSKNIICLLCNTLSCILLIKKFYWITQI